MKKISEMINLSDLSYYKYLKEFNVLQLTMDNAAASTIHQQKELIVIINILEKNSVNYTVDEFQNIILENT